METISWNNVSTACLLILGLYFLNCEEILFFPPLLCFFGAELLPVFPHSCLSETRNHKNAAAQSLSIELQFHLRSLKSSPASSESRAVSGVLQCLTPLLPTELPSPPAHEPHRPPQAISATGKTTANSTLADSTCIFPSNCGLFKPGKECVLLECL